MSYAPGKAKNYLTHWKMLVSLFISTLWGACVLGSRGAWVLGTQGGGQVVRNVVDSCWLEQWRWKQDRGCSGGRKAPKEGLMGHQRAIFPVAAHHLFWLSFVMLILRKVKGHTDIVWFFSLTTLKVIQDETLLPPKLNLLCRLCKYGSVL